MYIFEKTRFPNTFFSDPDIKNTRKLLPKQKQCALILSCTFLQLATANGFANEMAKTTFSLWKFLACGSLQPNWEGSKRGQATKSSTQHLLRRKGASKKVAFPFSSKRGKGPSKNPACFLEGAVGNFSWLDPFSLGGPNGLLP